MVDFQAIPMTDLNNDEEENLVLDDSLDQIPLTPNVPSNVSSKTEWRWIYMGAGSCLFLVLVILVIALGISNKHPTSIYSTNKQLKGVILMLGDGFGFSSQNMARTFYQTLKNLPADHKLPLDHILYGSVRTRSASSLVTDSAAGATAYACTKKTNNLMVGVTPDGKPCGTLMEDAYLRGFITSVVTTSRITHATPASFTAHVVSRNDEYTIATQQLSGYSPLKPSTYIRFGGGKCQHLPQRIIGSCGRGDGRDLFHEAKQQGVVIFSERSFFDQINSVNLTFPIVGLFQNDHMSYEIDRNPEEEPSLAEMTQKALELTVRQVDKRKAPGFLMLIEGARIDMAGHENDPAAHVWDTLAYNEAASVAISFVNKHPGTVLLAVSDHETGGLGLGGANLSPSYHWNPEYMLKMNASIEKSVQTLVKDLGNQQDPSVVLRQYFLKNFGMKEISDDEIKLLLPLLNNTYNLSIEIAQIVSNYLNIGWTTLGHTAVDIGMYVYGIDNLTLKSADFLDEILLSKSFSKSKAEWPLTEWSGRIPLDTNLGHQVENVDVGQWIESYLNLNLQNLTQILNKQQ